VPAHAIINQLREVGKDDERPVDAVEEPHIGPKMLFCITMYQEDWNQILQSVAGCIRAILELEDQDDETYSSKKFGIVLICGKFL
jgi:hypothetical protein